MSYEQPAFHVTGGQGWINDPNGFSYFNNQYHLFYQYHPFSTQWGPMHWGHVVSSDLVHWERMPIALYPDQPYDKDGCFSGTALSLEDGRHLLMYTGVKDGYQAQCMAFGDGLSYEKYADNPVIDIQDKDFRDPKIWQEDGWFYMVAVHRAADGNGEALLYRSSDALHWEFCSQLASGRDQLNGMWECPDFFQLNEHPMLLLSVMECDLFSTSRGVVALTGAYVDHQLNWSHILPLDLGIDFYAPQTLRTSDGRHLMIGWMQNWGTSKSVPEGMDWFGQMTLPRELRLENGRLLQTPIQEIENYRGEVVHYENVTVTETLALTGVQGRLADMTVTLQDTLQPLTIDVAADDEHAVQIIYNPADSTITLDRTCSGGPTTKYDTCAFSVAPENRQLKLRFIMDRYSLELFVNDGQQAATITYYTPQEADRIQFHAENPVQIDVEFYRLKL